MLWAAALAAYGVRTKVEKVGSAFQIIVSGGDAVKLAGLYFLFGPPLLEGGDERVISHKLVEAVELGSKVSVRIEEGAGGGSRAAPLWIYTYRLVA